MWRLCQDAAIRVDSHNLTDKKATKKRILDPVCAHINTSQHTCNMMFYSHIYKCIYHIIIPIIIYNYNMQRTVYTHIYIDKRSMCTHIRICIMIMMDPILRLAPSCVSFYPAPWHQGSIPGSTAEAEHRRLNIVEEGWQAEQKKCTETLVYYTLLLFEYYLVLDVHNIHIVFILRLYMSKGSLSFLATPVMVPPVPVDLHFISSQAAGALAPRWNQDETERRRFIGRV